MYGRIFITTLKMQAQFKTNAHDSIYSFLIECGYDHSDAAEVADWAELAGYGETFVLPGAEIYIVE